MSGKTPSVALFCATFLKPEMLHIHRHVQGLTTFSPLVLAQKQEGDWPVERLEIIPRSPWRFLGRGREKRTGAPWQISGGETRRFQAALQREDCVLLHVFFGNAAVHLLPWFRQLRVPLVVSFHGSDVAGSMASPGYTSAVRELFALATLVPCRSEQLAAQVAALGCPPEKLRLMRTILPDLPIVPRQPPADGAWHIVQAARLVEKKGLFTALRAFAIFARRHPGAHFTIAGEGPLEERLRAEVDALGLTDRVTFRGFLSQEALRQLFAESHLFFHPSETAGGDVEGVPNALLEAMATGLPPVATRHGGIPEVIQHRENGLLAPERDAEGLEALLEEIAGDPALYAALAARAAASVRAQFSEEKQIAAIESLYREAILLKSGTKPVTPSSAA